MSARSARLGHYFKLYSGSAAGLQAVVTAVCTTQDACEYDTKKPGVLVCGQNGKAGKQQAQFAMQLMLRKFLDPVSTKLLSIQVKK